MTKFLAICAVFLFMSALFLWFRADYWQNKAENLTKENKNLNLTVERAKNAEKEANKTITSLRQSAQTCKTNLDWYRMPVPVDVLDELRKRHNRHRTS